MPNWNAPCEFEYMPLFSKCFLSTPTNLQRYKNKKKLEEQEAESKTKACFHGQAGSRE